MWVAHIAPGLMVKPFVPNVPLWVLGLAGALPDALHFLFNILRIESFNFDARLAQQGCGCLPYSNNYPFTHSMLGMAVAGLVYAGIYTILTDRRVTLRDQAVIFFTVLSHHILELLANHLKITLADDCALGAGLFNHSMALFILEMTILYTGFLVWHFASPPFAKAGAIRDPWLPRALFMFFALEEAHFCFGSAPTLESRFIHAPLFLSEIMLNSYLVARLD